MFVPDKSGDAGDGIQEETSKEIFAFGHTKDHIANDDECIVVFSSLCDRPRPYDTLEGYSYQQHRSRGRRRSYSWNAIIAVYDPVC